MLLNYLSQCMVDTEKVSDPPLDIATTYLQYSSLESPSHPMRLALDYGHWSE